MTPAEEYRAGAKDLARSMDAVALNLERSIEVLERLAATSPTVERRLYCFQVSRRARSIWEPMIEAAREMGQEWRRISRLPSDELGRTDDPGAL